MKLNYSFAMSSLELDISDVEYPSLQESDYEGGNESGSPFNLFLPVAGSVSPMKLRQVREVSMLSDHNHIFSNRNSVVHFPKFYLYNTTHTCS